MLKTRWLPSLLLLLPVAVCSDALSDSKPNWENPAVFRVNKEPARSFFYSVSDEKYASLDEPWGAPSYQLMNGLWRFNWVEAPGEIPDGFQTPGFNDASWDEFPVPANWEINGYGIPYYHSHACFDTNAVPLDLPEDDQPVGTYRKHFTVPEGWADKEIFIHFGAVKSAFTIYVNGEEVGYSQDSKTAAEFNVTPYVQEGDNLLALQVHRYSDGSYLECQDMWRLSGITRNVYLHATPKVRVRDFHAYTTLTNGYSDGVLKFDVDVANHSKSVARGYTLDLSLFDDAAKLVKSQTLSIDAVKAGNEVNETLSVTVESARKWSAETPNLYRLDISLNDPQGSSVEFVRRYIGFRSTELKDGNILINGRPVLFKGVNRHEHDPKSGHVISRELMEKDVKLLKQNNFNAVRLAHYPSDPYLYDLADRYGLYVMDEANIESHGLGAANQASYDPSVHPVNDPGWKAAYIDRISNMYERSKNNPSVVVRSLGNESGDGPNLEASYDWLKEQEPSPVISEQAQLRRHTDAYGQMYASIDSLIHYAETYESSRPAILIEYEHAMGNSLGNFEEYWDLFEQYDELQGAFIWDWVDQTFEKTAPDGTKFWAYGGDLEPPNTPNSDSFAANGLVDAARVPYPYLAEVKRVHQNINIQATDIQSGKLVVDNRFFFSTLKPYKLYWELLEDGAPVAKGGNIDLSAAPRTSESIELDYDYRFDSGKEYFLNVSVADTRTQWYAEAGYIVAEAQLAFPYDRSIPVIDSDGTVMVREESDELIVSGEGFVYRFDTKTGQLSSIEVAGKEVLLAQPRPNFWRAPTDNDLPASDFQDSLSTWQDVGKDLKLVSFDVVEASRSRLRIKTEHRIPSIESRYFMTHTVDGSGAVNVDVWFYAAPHKKQPTLPRIGVLFEFDKQFNNVLYYGRGPHENYRDRKASADVGLYRTTVEELFVPYVRPQENGLRTDVRKVAFFDEQGDGLQFFGEPLLQFGADYHSQDDYDSSAKEVKEGNMHPHELPEGKGIFVKIDHRHRGVGGTDSWGEPPLFQYTVPWLDYQYRYGFRPYSNN